ncbi:MAG: hypothetical protein K2N16_10335 [Muribaculaceae bacterium]|nr:hypothetical protein [Muribaculaceae bacterium]
MARVLLLTLGLMAAAVLMLSAKVLLKKGAKFPTDKAEHHRVMSQINRKPKPKP